MINGKLYDVGGCAKYPNFVDDKVVLKYLKKLFKNAKIYEELKRELAKSL